MKHVKPHTLRTVFICESITKNLPFIIKDTSSHKIIQDSRAGWCYTVCCTCRQLLLLITFHRKFWHPSPFKSHPDMARKLLELTLRTPNEHVFKPQSLLLLQVKDLPPLWDALFKDLSCSVSKADEVALLTQHINEKLFERVVTQQATVEPSEVEVPPLSENEANVLRYAAGYVPFVLKKKLSNRPEFIKFLSTLAVEGEQSDYLGYTRRWVDLVDRGGLFRVNDQLYTFFVDPCIRRDWVLFRNITQVYFHARHTQQKCHIPM